jgi:DNA gyrase subunit A
LINRLDLTLEDLIPEEEVVVTLSHAGYAKSQPLDTYRAQRRGGRGKAATSFKAEDFIDKLFVANSHDTILCFSSSGKVYWLKAYELPQAGRIARGKPMVNLLPLEDGERITAILPIRDYSPDQYILMATSYGIVKKTALPDFSRPRSNGIIAIDLREADRLIGVAITDGTRDIILVSDAGKAIRFSETDVRPTGRTAQGVRGIRLGRAQQMISLMIADHKSTILVATEQGYGKRTPIEAFPRQGRGGQGVIAIQASARNGHVIGAVMVSEGDEIMLISDGGTLVRTPVKDISVTGRNTQGVTLIRLSGSEQLVQVERIERINGKEQED